MPTTIPTKTDGSLGAVLSNTRTPVENELSAVHLERIKSLLIEISTEIGETGAPDPGSILGRLNLQEWATTNLAGGTSAVLTATPTVVVVDTTGVGTLTLPNPSTVTTESLAFLIIDRDNNAATKPIALNRSASEKIDGVAGNKSLATNGGRWLVWTNGVDWYTLQTGPSAGGSGDVVGPASSTDNAVARYDGTTGKILQDGAVTVGDSGEVAGVASIVLVEQVSGPTPATNSGALYAKDVGDATHLFYKPDTGSEVQITRSDGLVNHGTQSGGSLHAAATPSSAGFMSAEHADLLGERTLAGEWYEDFVNGITSTPYAATASGAGAGAINPASPPTQPHFGVVYMGAGTTTTGRVAISPTRAMCAIGNGAILFSARVLLVTLADVTEDYEIAIGLSNNNTSPDPSMGVWFAYDRIGSGANWRARTYNNDGGGATDVDTGVAVAAGAWVNLAIEFTATEARFYINGTLVATTTTKLPAATLFPTPGIYKSAGTTDRGMYLDYTRLRAAVTR